MKIAGAHLQMASSHVASQTHEIRESLRAWAGTPPGDGGGGNSLAASPLVQISETARSALAKGTEAATDERASVDNDPKLLLIRIMLEFMTGKKVKVFDSRELAAKNPSQDLPDPSQAGASNGSNPPSSAGFGVEYERHEIYTETERTSFSAQGVVQTADGREISFDLRLLMERSYSESSDISLRLGDAARKKDPLILNFAGAAAQLTDTRFHFDLDADGEMDEINFVASGSGFLALDHNGNGKVDDGSELFGPSTGDGYKELARLDDDGNGWIDESDKAYSELRIWTKDADGRDRLLSLAESQVGALAVAHVGTPFDIKGNSNELKGFVRDSGVFLHEDGKAGTIQQIDLVV